MFIYRVKNCFKGWASGQRKSDLFVYVLCLVYGDVQHLLFCGFACFACNHVVSCFPDVASFSWLSIIDVLYARCCQFLLIVHYWCLVCPMLPVSLDCPLLMSCVPDVASFSWLSIIDVLCARCCQFLLIVHYCIIDCSFDFFNVYLLREMTFQSMFNKYECFYVRTRNCDLLIQVTA